MNQDRRDRIVRLLETRDDNLPVMRGTAQLAGRQPGFAHNTLAPAVCDVCDGVDSFACPGCGGRGEVERMRERDPYAKDVTLPYGLSPDRHERTREREAELDRLADQTEPPATSEADVLASLTPERWEIERRRMYRKYDYAALDQLLDQLLIRDQGAYHLLHGVYVYGYVEPSATVEMLVERGLRYLEEHMPDTIRAPGFEFKHPALIRRDKQAAKRHDEAA